MTSPRNSCLAGSEPPFVERCGAPSHRDRYVELLSRDALVPKVRELGYTFTALGSDGGAVRAGLLGFVAALKTP